MNLLYTVNVPLLAGLYSGLPQRIPMHLYTVNAPINNNSWTLFRVISAYTNAFILYTVNAPIIIVGLVLYTGLPQRIPMHLATLYGECTFFIAGQY